MSLAASAILRRWLLLALCVFSSLASAVTLTPQEQAIANKMISDPGQHRPFLKLDPTLVAVARARALDLGTRKYFDHVNPDGHGPNYMVQAAGYPLPAWWGNDPEANYIESIAGGHSDASSTWDDWMNSTPHRDHLLANTSFDAANTSYGVGYAAVPGSPFTYYWVVITCPPRPEPLLAVTSPVNGARVTEASVAFTGTTSSDSGTAKVVTRVEFGDAHTEFVAASGTTAWTATVSSLQPGANTIRVRSLNGSGGLIAEVTRVVTYVVLKPLTVAAAGSGSVTAGFLGTTQRELGHKYSLTATPAAGSLFTGWTGSATARTAALSFTMAEGFTLTANFVLNPFLTRTGGYTGLLAGAEEGLVKISLTANGVFTGTLRYAGAAFPLSARLAPDGSATIVINRKGLTPLTVTLQLDVAGTGGISASVNDAGQISATTATSLYKASAGVFAAHGRYTIALPPSSNAGAPQGDGYGTMVVDKTGHAALVFSLTDGTRVQAGGAFSGDSLVFYVPLYTAQGAFSGRLQLRDQPASDLDGSVHWKKPALPKARIHPDAIDATSALLGSHYTAPTKGDLVLDLNAGVNNGMLFLDDGDLPASVAQPVTIDSTNRVWVANPAVQKLAVKINPASGTYSGSFTHPVSGKASVLRGVIFQRQNAGLGYFLGADASGSTRLSAP